MTTTAVKEFTKFFRHFLDLCLSSGWPADDTEPEEISRALEVAHHIDMCVKKMKSEKNCLNKFLDLLCTNQNFTHVFLQNCMSDPSKFILKKIINSDAPVKNIDIAFKRFQHLYSEERLVKLLSELMVEAASKETLLRNMSSVLPEYNVLELTNHLHLSVILECDSQELIADTLKDCSQEMMDTFVSFLGEDNMVGWKKEDKVLVRKKLITAFTNVMDCRDSSVNRFWKLLFNVDKENLVEMCVKYKTLSEMIFEALVDGYKLIRDNTPVEFRFVHFTEPQLHSKCNMILEKENLKCEFIKFMKKNRYDDIYQIILQN